MDAAGKRTQEPGAGTEEASCQDEAAAAWARRLYRTAGMAPVDADPELAGLLRPGELVFATRPVAIVSRSSPDGVESSRTVDVKLCLTSERLVAGEPANFEVDLAAIEEAVVSGDHLLLVLRDGAGLALRVEEPLLLRVQIAAVRSGVRATRADGLGATVD